MIRHVRLKGKFENEFFPVDLEDLLPLLVNRSDAGRRKKASEAESAAADSLDEGALRHQFKFHLPLVEESLRRPIQPNMRRCHLAALAVHHELAVPYPFGVLVVRVESVVRYKMQVVRALRRKRVDESVGNPRVVESSHHQRRTCLYVRHGLLGGHDGLDELMRHEEMPPP